MRHRPVLLDYYSAAVAIRQWVILFGLDSGGRRRANTAWVPAPGSGQDRVLDFEKRLEMIMKAKDRGRPVR